MQLVHTMVAEVEDAVFVTCSLWSLIFCLYGFLFYGLQSLHVDIGGEDFFY